MRVRGEPSPEAIVEVLRFLLREVNRREKEGATTKAETVMDDPHSIDRDGASA